MGTLVAVLWWLGWIGWVVLPLALLERHRARRSRLRADAITRRAHTRLERLDAALREVLPLLAALLPVEVVREDREQGHERDG